MQESNLKVVFEVFSEFRKLEAMDAGGLKNLRQNLKKKKEEEEDYTKYIVFKFL